MQLFSTRSYGNPNNAPIIVLAGWAMTHWQQLPLVFNLVARGYYCISYTYAKEILTPDIPQTLTYIHQVKRDIRNTIQTVYAHTGQSIPIFGTSLGALLGILASKENPYVKKLILNVPAFHIAEAIWRWDQAVPIFKDILIRDNYDFKILKKELSPIEPVRYLHQLRDKQVLAFVSQTDIITPCNIDRLKELFNMHQLDYELIIHKRMGHVLAAAYNMVFWPRYIRFLRDEQSNRLAVGRV